MTEVVARVALVLALRVAEAGIVQCVPLTRGGRAHGSVAEVAAAHQVSARLAEVLQEGIDAARQAVGCCHSQGAHVVPVGFLCLFEPDGLQGALVFGDGAVLAGDADDVGPYVVEELYPVVELPEVVAVVADAGACSFASEACGIGVGAEVNGSRAHDVGQILVLIDIAVVPDGEEHGVAVAAIASGWHLNAGVHAVGADCHLIGGWLLIGAGVHYFQVGPIVALSRGRSLILLVPPEVYAGGHEYLRVGDAEGRGALEEQVVEAVQVVGAVRTGQLEAVPPVVGHLGVGHDLHCLLCRCLLRAAGSVFQNDGAGGGMDDADAEGDVLAALGLELGIGPDVSRREVDAIDEGGSLRVVPVDVG